jgi:predicted ester cyclase
MRFPLLGCLVVLSGSSLSGCIESSDPIAPSPPPVAWGSFDAGATAPVATTPSVSPSTDRTAARVALVQALLGAISDLDSVAFAGKYAEDATASIFGESVWNGRADIGAMLRDFYQPFSGIKATPTRITVNGDRVAVEWVMTGTQAKSWMGADASGKTVAVPVLSIYKFDAHDRVAVEHTYFDEVGALVQIGAASHAMDRGSVVTPADTPTIVGAKGGADETANTTLVASAANALAQNSADAVVAPYASDIEIWSATRAKTTKGKDAAKKEVAEFLKTFGDVKVTVDAWGAGALVVDEREVKATNIGSYAGNPPTKKAADWQEATVSEVKEGKVVRSWNYVNRRDIFAELGIRYQH